MFKQYGLKKKEDIGKANYEAKRINRESKLAIDKALEEDPSIFEYDEVYDDIKKKQDEVYKKGSSSSGPKQSKFIGNLLSVAERRKMDQERVNDRKIQKEREAEGDEFDDKEVFVTGAYKQKLLERQIYDEKEKKEKELEALMDVRKQEHGISAFYRNFINQRVGETVELRPQQKFLDKITEGLKQQMMSEKDKEVEDKADFKKSSKNTQSKRQRRSSSSSEEEDVVIHKSSKSKDRRKESKKNKEKTNKDETKNDLESNNDVKQQEDKDLEKKEEVTKNDDENKNDKKEDVEEVKDVEPVVKLTLREILTDLFRKKCVDDEFLEAQKRYFERRANY